MSGHGAIILNPKDRYAALCVGERRDTFGYVLAHLLSVTRSLAPGLALKQRLSLEVLPLGDANERRDVDGRSGHVRVPLRPSS